MNFHVIKAALVVWASSYAPSAKFKFQCTKNHLNFIENNNFWIMPGMAGYQHQLHLAELFKAILQLFRMRFQGYNYVMACIEYIVTSSILFSACYLTFAVQADFFSYVWIHFVKLFVLLSDCDTMLFRIFPPFCFLQPLKNQH